MKSLPKVSDRTIVTATCLLYLVIGLITGYMMGYAA
jgi:hypothetical protein